jgi:ribosomal protein L31E
MGKARKLKINRRGPKVSLDKQIEDDQFAKPSSRVKVRARKDEDEEVIMMIPLWYSVEVNEFCPKLNEQLLILCG